MYRTKPDKTYCLHVVSCDSLRRVVQTVYCADNRRLAGVVGFLFLVTNIATSVTIKKSLAAEKRPTFLFGPGRSLLSMTTVYMHVDESYDGEGKSKYGTNAMTS